ncbi:TonB-dependent receptor [Desulforhabdus amnigena]|uniref:TonB-dependent receptor n=1 Tax=Desulforhabdus amnigena TaxID=40218 RepID=A0A9W6FV52_9BACT|nr:TonB-dependent receptor plug domain-containing protein [Desulforhabdus amnigena]NLJ29411.1 TonB-dependent receptor plug domain-containing protein [Deltaproteobacteria bacterium]GLI35402.1 TonB-dependent receptor [Desulforhabdus amnigena]
MRVLVLLLSICSVFFSGEIFPEYFCSNVHAEEMPLEVSTQETKSNASQQEKAGHNDTYGMEEVVVVAPPVIEGNQVNRLGSQVTVVTEQQIEDLNAQDLPSALRMTPGVVISHHNPIGSFGGGEGGTIFIRGMGISRPGAEIQILVDGVPKFVSVWTHPLMDVLSVDVIEEMQVYKGAQPVLFGNMAFGAVDITTKRKHEEGYTTSVEGAGGSFNTWVEVAEHGGKVGPLDYYLIQSYRRSDGHRDNADGELQNYFGHFGYQLSNNWDAGIVFNRTDNWADDPGPVDGSFPPDGRFETNDYFTVGTLSNHYERSEGYIKFYSENGHIDWINQYNETTGKNDEDTITDYDNYGLRGRQTLRLWEGGEILLGMDLDFISGKVDISSPPNPESHFDRTTFRLFSPYTAVSQMFGSKEGFYAIPSAGVRYIDHSQFASEPGPQAGLIVGYKNTELHASCARGINYPGIFAKANDALFLPGNNRWDDLTAELVDHYEAGMSHKVGNMAKMDLTFFYDDGKNRIVVAPPPPFPPTWSNVGSFTNEGVEATFTVSPLRDLSFFAGATYLNSDPDDLPYAPEWSASFGANYRFLKHFQASIDASYVDNYFVTSRARKKDTVNLDKVDSYCLLNAKLTYDFTLPYRDLHGQFFVAGENLTDTDYEQKKGYPMPGISGMSGIKLWF